MTHTLTERKDFYPLWDIGAIHIGADVGDEECFYISIIDDLDIESNETFKVQLEVVDVNAYALVDTATIRIIDDDNVTSMFKNALAYSLYYFCGIWCLTDFDSYL